MSLVQLVASDIQQAIKHFEQSHQRFAYYFATKTGNSLDNYRRIVELVEQVGKY